MDIFLLINSLSAYKNQDIIDNYSFITFFLTSYFSNMVTSNPSNQNKLALPKIVYRLCSGQTYQPTGLSPSMSAGYNKLLSRMTTQQTTTIVRQSSNNSLNFLLYILLPSVIFIILLLLYIQYARKSNLEEMKLKEAIENLKKNTSET
jgi:hypothetical protein